jgi:polyphosphate kinase
MIQAESRPGGRIAMKMNSLVDPEMIDALYIASQAGCDVDLMVRGICCLLPGIPGLSERIVVRSIVGRYLEHSRIFRFGGGDDARYLIGSADLMPRNLDHRVECLVEVTDPGLRARLDEIIDVNLADDVLAWDLRPEGWERVAQHKGLESHTEFRRLAEERALP